MQCVFLGSPNPYVWNEDAIRCAVLRRQILADLVPFWLGPAVQVANAEGFRWNDELRTFEMQTEFVCGRPLDLRHPLRSGECGLAPLLAEIMAPLQKRLREAGFDGLVWQAGRGNPVALNNFLLEPRADGGGVWWWIDLESGVPALAPMNPVALLTYYLPRSCAHRRPLFDDVDAGRLRSYVDGQRAALSERLGQRGLRDLVESISELECCQTAWKSLSRLDCSLGYRLAKRSISAEEADWYHHRPLRWYSSEALRAGKSALRRAGRFGRTAFERLRSIDVVKLARYTTRFLTSQRFRAELARDYVGGRLAVWRSRGQLNDSDAEILRSHLDREESGSYLTDFGVHIAIKPLVKSIEYWVFPALFAFALISETTLAVALITGGSIGRTGYTAGRLLQSVLRGRERPWVALLVGALPVVGNFAFPLQILYSSTEGRDHLARFILYDGCARLGEHLPIWGGRDTLTEHRLNRLPDLLPRRR